MNYDYNKINGNLNDFFPYGTLKIYVVKTNTIQFTTIGKETIGKSKNDPIRFYIRILLNDRTEIYTWFENGQQVEEAMSIINANYGKIALLMADGPDDTDNRLQRDYITMVNSPIYKEALNCL